MGHCHDWRRLRVLSDNVLGKYSTWTSSIYLQENRNLWLLTMFYLFKLTRLQFCNYCWAIRAYSHTCNQALSFSVLADLSHMLYIEKQVHFVPVAEFAVTLLHCTPNHHPLTLQLTPSVCDRNSLRDRVMLVWTHSCVHLLHKWRSRWTVATILRWLHCPLATPLVPLPSPLNLLTFETTIASGCVQLSMTSCT